MAKLEVLPKRVDVLESRNKVGGQIYHLDAKALWKYFEMEKCC
ncbi:hypothetical protein SAMN04487761_13517 [Lachnospiraceae bacterium C7]|nr:hypothetical protein SAMN04487761_13517 [Lachnospiraceae bacterium C7]